ncbi:hypothetical protein [Mycobacterium sp. IDR2000157661]|uniref:hypothetical protein n=1 Tax=Mycobacterium sp. IDR2000157661 TaxID=2867005 RepID=UPI001EEB3092|nr:hypothetical protein [Mycobacterium sp. IDR2000157661]ULE32574.1 hypothetical protein K3G64_21150 [Mycobacterium sp. IDR2000157661]
MRGSLVALAGLLIVLAGCGDQDSGSEPSTRATSAITAPDPGTARIPPMPIPSSGAPASPPPAAAPAGCDDAPAKIVGIINATTDNAVRSVRAGAGPSP